MALSRKVPELDQLNQQYIKLLALAQEKGIKDFQKRILNLEPFFQQADRWEGNEIMRKRVSEETFNKSLFYVEDILDDVSSALENHPVDSDWTSAITLGCQVQRLLAGPRVNAGVDLVDELDKNTPKSRQHYKHKRNLVLGLLGVIGGVLLMAGVGALIGIYLVPFLAGVSIVVLPITLFSVAGYVLISALAGFVISKLAPAFCAKHDRLFRDVSFALILLPLLPLLPIMLIAAGIVSLKSLSDLSKNPAKNRQGLSHGLAQATPLLKSMAHVDDQPSYATMTDHTKLEATYQAKINKAAIKRDGFYNFREKAGSKQQQAYVEAGVAYYEKRIEALEAMRTFEILRGLALTQDALKEKRCDLSQAERADLKACAKPDKNALLEAKHAFTYGSPFKGIEGDPVDAAVKNVLEALPVVNDHTKKRFAFHAQNSGGYIHGQANANGKLFMFERLHSYHRTHAEKFEAFTKAKIS